MTLTELFTDIANAIRSKTGGASRITPSNFASEISNITTGYNLKWVGYGATASTTHGHNSITVTCGGATVGKRYLCVVYTSEHSNNSGSINNWLSGMTKETYGGSSGGYSSGVSYAIGIATSTSIGIKNWYPFYVESSTGHFVVALFELVEA